MSDDPTAVWLAGLAAEVAPTGAGVRERLSAPGPAVVRRTTASGAELAFLGDVVVKLHHPRTDAVALARRLGAVVRGTGKDVWLQPLEDSPRRCPDGRVATAWPCVDVLEETDADVPWAEAARLLAVLHLTGRDLPGAELDALPVQGGPARVGRTLTRVGALDHPAAAMLERLGTRLLDEAMQSPGRRTVVHGDWHLGQLARTRDGLRLLDVDDLGFGDPAWDLSRPAGFWAAGLLEDSAWECFLTAYRDAGGPAVPRVGDPWPDLDLATRCAVFVAAVRSLGVQPTHSTDPADALLEACARM